MTLTFNERLQCQPLSWGPCTNELIYASQGPDELRGHHYSHFTDEGTKAPELYASQSTCGKGTQETIFQSGRNDTFMIYTITIGYRQCRIDTNVSKLYLVSVLLLSCQQTVHGPAPVCGPHVGQHEVGDLPKATELVNVGARIWTWVWTLDHFLYLVEGPRRVWPLSVIQDEHLREQGENTQRRRSPQVGVRTI